MANGNAQEVNVNDDEPAQDDGRDDIPAVRYLVGDSLSRDEALEAFRQSSLSEGIDAESESDFVRQANERALEAIGREHDTDFPALRVASNMGPEVPDDDVYNAFQKSQLSKQVQSTEPDSVESFMRQRLFEANNVGESPQAQQEAQDDSVELVSEDPDDDTELKKLRAVMPSEGMSDQELLSSFQRSQHYDPDSDLDPVSQAEQFASKALYGKVNRDIQEQQGQVGSQQNIDFERDPEETEESWTDWAMSFFESPLEEEEQSDRAPGVRDAVTPITAVSQLITGESGTPPEQIAQLLGNEDVETSSDFEDEVISALGAPLEMAAFGLSTAAGTAGGTVDLAEKVAETPVESYYGTDMPDVPGLEETGAAEKVMDEDGNVRSPSELIMEANNTEDTAEKRSLFKAAVLERRKQKFQDMSTLDKTDRLVNNVGRGLVSGGLGLARELAAAQYTLEQEISPDMQEDLDDQFLNTAASTMENYAHKYLMPVDNSVKGNWLTDELAMAVGTMGSFALGSRITSGAARLGAQQLGTRVSVGKTATQGARMRSAGSMRNLDADDAADLVGADSPRISTRLGRVDEATQSGARAYIAKNADDFERTLREGAGTRFHMDGSLTRAQEQVLGATKTAPALQGGGMIRWDAYQRTKQVPDPSVYPNHIEELIRRDRAGEDLALDERREMNAAIESRAVEAGNRAAPAGYLEGAAGGVIDEYVRGLTGAGNGVTIAALEGAGTEFAQETLSGAYSETVNQIMNNPNLSPFKGLLSEGAAGAFAGALMRGSAAAEARIGSQSAQLERLGVEDGKVPPSNLGQKRRGQYAEQRARERRENDQTTTRGMSLARTLDDMQGEQKDASVAFDLTHESSRQVRNVVPYDMIEDADPDAYATRPQLERQDQVADAINSMIEGIGALDDQQKDALRKNFHFHDVQGRELTSAERDHLGVDDTEARYNGVTYSDAFSDARFGTSHVFAGASRADAFEELFHALYDHAGDDAKQRVVDAYNQTIESSIGVQEVESYEDGAEDIASYFAREIESQADIDPSNALDQIERTFTSLGNAMSPSNPVQQEVADLMRGEVDLDWDAPINREQDTVVIVGPTQTEIQGPDGDVTSIPMGVAQMNEVGREQIRRRAEELGGNTAYLVEADPVAPSRTGDNVEDLVNDLEELHSQFRTSIEPAIDEARQAVVGDQQASDAAQQQETSKGLPDLDGDINIQDVKSIGFRHANHAANAVNRDRRQKGMEEYDEGETIPAEEVYEAAQNPDRVRRRLREEGQIPDAVNVNVNSPSRVDSTDPEAVQREEQRLREHARDATVVAGEQDAIKAVTNQIRRYQSEADALRREAQESDDNMESLLREADKKERFANALARGLNERMARTQEDISNDADLDLRGQGTPVQVPQNARIPRFAESRYLPNEGIVVAWDPGAADPTGRREEILNRPTPTEAAQETQDEGTTAPEGARVINTNQISGASQGDVVTVVDDATIELAGREVGLSLVSPESAQALGMRQDAPQARELPEQQQDREGVWVLTEDLARPDQFLETARERRQQAESENRMSGAQQQQSQIDRVKAGLSRVQGEETQAEAETADLDAIDRLDPENVTERSPAEQIIFEANLGRRALMAGNFGEAQRRQDRALRIANENDINLFDETSPDNDSEARREASITFQELTNEIDEGVPDLGVPEGVIPVSDMESLQDALEKVGVDPETAEATAASFDARAEAFASQTGLSKDVWYASRIAGISELRQQFGEQALNQIRAWHGTPYFFPVHGKPFSTEFIDAGEGAQAYGWGLYFTGSEVVAREHYADKLWREKGRITWNLLDGQYQVRREEGETTMTIIGPDGETLGQVEQEERPFVTTKQQVIRTLDQAREIVAQDALERGIEDDANVLAEYQSARAQVQDTERQFFRAAENLRVSPQFMELARNIRELITQYASEPVTASAADLAFEIESDIQDELIMGRDIEAILNGEAPMEIWTEDGPYSELLLTAESEFGVTDAELELLRGELAAQYSARALEAVTDEYMNAATQHRRAKEQMRQARNRFIDNLDATIEDTNRVVAEALLHDGRDPSEYNYMRWRREATQEEYEAFLGALDQLREDHNLLSAHSHSSWDAFREAIEAARDGVEGRVNSRDLFFDRQNPEVRHIYSAFHEMTGATPQDISLALLDNGVDGIVYQGNQGAGDYDNFVIFDDSEVTLQSAEVFQKRDGNVVGATDFMRDGRALIGLFTENPDADTIVEEAGHMLLEDMPFSDRQIIADAVDDPNATATHMTPEAHEQFADWFRRYVRDGEAPNTTLEQVMARLKALVREVWARISGTAVNEEIPPEVRATMDRLFLPNDPRANEVQTQDPNEAMRDPGVPGLRIAQDGTRMFYPEAYLQATLNEGQETQHHKLTPEEFAAYEEIAPPQTIETTNPHQKATQQAVLDNKQVPEASKREYVMNAPISPEAAAESFFDGKVEPDDIGPAEETEVFEGDMPPSIANDAELKSETEVGEGGQLVTELTDNELETAGVQQGEFRSEAEVEEAQSGKMMMRGRWRYITAEKVAHLWDIAINGQPAQDVIKLRNGLENDDYMTQEEIRDFRRREDDPNEEVTQDERDRFNETQDFLYETLGADHQAFATSIEEALSKTRQQLERNIARAKLAYEKMLPLSRSQPDFTDELNTDFQRELRQRFSQTAAQERVREEVAETLESNTVEEIAEQVGTAQLNRQQARNDDLPWKRQAQGFDNPVDWFEEFWMNQTSRRADQRLHLGDFIRDVAPDYLAGGTPQIRYESTDEDARNARQKGNSIWKSFSMKSPDNLNGGILWTQTVNTDGVANRAVLATPSFAIEIQQDATTGAYTVQMREPTEEELNLTQVEASQRKWRDRANQQIFAMTEGPGNFRYDTFGQDEGDYSVDEKVEMFAETRRTYRVSDDVRIVERSAPGNRTDADNLYLSVITPEAQGPVAAFYDQESGQLELSTTDEVAAEIEAQYGDQIRDAIEDIRAQDEEGPDLFGDEQVVSTESVSDNTQDYVEGLTDMLGLDQRIAVVAPQDVDPDDPGAFTGEHRAGRMIQHDSANEMSDAPTWAGQFGNGDWYIVVREGEMNQSYEAEAIAHEIGHVISTDILNSDRHADAQARLRGEHEQALQDSADMTVGEFTEQFMSYHRLRSSEYLDSISDLTMDELMEVNPEMYRYLTSFEEWVAEQTARYVTTQQASAQQDGAVRAFFEEVAQYFRTIYRFLMENGFGPNVEFASWVRHHVTEKETNSRLKQVRLGTAANPYMEEVRARQAIERSRETVPMDVREDIRNAVRNGNSATGIIAALDGQASEAGTLYAKAFRRVLRAQEREAPENGSATIQTGYAVNAPTDAIRQMRLDEVLDHLGVRDNNANKARRVLQTTSWRRLDIMSDQYPELQSVLDDIFAPADRAVEGATFDEARQQAVNEYVSRLASIMRRAVGVSAIDPRGLVNSEWTAGAQRLKRIKEILETEGVDATREESIRQVEDNDRVVQLTMEMRELFNDFFDYLVEADALPEDARLENYFPATLDTESVMNAPEQFENMLVNQMRKRAEAAGNEWTGTMESQAGELAHRIRKNIVGAKQEDFLVRDFLEQDRTNELQDKVGLEPSSLKRRMLRFLNHSAEEVQEFYEQDPANALPSYFYRNIRFAEFARRFGPEGEKVKGVIQTLNDAGATDEVKMLRSQLLALQNRYESWDIGNSIIARGFRSSMRVLRNVTNLVMMQMVTFSTFPEITTVIQRTGVANAVESTPAALYEFVMNGSQTLAIKARQTFGEDVTRDRKGFQRVLSESAVLADASARSIIQSRVMQNTEIEGNVMRAFYNINMLRPWTRAMRTWSAVAGHRHILDALQNAEQEGRMMRELERLGLPTDRESRADMIDIIDRMMENDEGAWQTDAAQQYLTAIERLGQQTVVESNAANRPLWLSDRNPFFRVFGMFKTFSTAFREGPMAYVSDETIQNQSLADGTQQMARIAPTIIGAALLGGMGEWLKYLLYYDRRDIEQRRAHNQMKTEGWEAVLRGIERSGYLGPATFGTYYPIMSVRKYNSNALQAFLGPGVSFGDEFATAFINAVTTGNGQRLYNMGVGVLPGGQAMRFREQYKEWINRQAGWSPPMPPTQSDTVDFPEDDADRN